MTPRDGYTPRPPRHIETEMEAAGRDNDKTRLDLATAAYETWLTDHGYRTPQRGTGRPDQEDR